MPVLEIVRPAALTPEAITGALGDDALWTPALMIPEHGLAVEETRWQQILHKAITDAIAADFQSLNVPLDEIVGIASTAMWMAGVQHRLPDDRDGVVSEEVFNFLAKQPGWELSYHANGEARLQDSKKRFDVSKGWNLPHGNEPQTLEELLRDATVCNSVRFTALTRVLRWKEQKGRAKDVVDVIMIKRRLAGLALQNAREALFPADSHPAGAIEHPLHAELVDAEVLK